MGRGEQDEDIGFSQNYMSFLFFGRMSFVAVILLTDITLSFVN